MFALYTKSNGRSNRERVLLPVYAKCINITDMTIKKRINSKQKGKRGEREAASVLNRIFSVLSRRGQQHKGTEDSPDVEMAETILHPEVKYTERLSLYEAIDQAIRDAGESKIPFVMHRRNHREWLFIISENHFKRFVIEAHRILDEE
jgi:hypothetical protein